METLENFFTVSDQTMLFLYSVILGALLGIIFDFFRVARIIVPHKSIFVAIEDTIFIAFCGFATVIFSYQYARGQVRFFYIVGSLLGFLLYHFTLGNIVVEAIRKIVLFIYGILSRIFRLCMIPLRWLFVPIYQKIGCFFVGIRTKFKKLQAKTKICLKDRSKMLYNKRTHHRNKEVKKVEKNRRKNKKKIQRSVPD